MFQNVKQSSQLYRQNHVSLNDTQRSFFSNLFFPSFPEKDLTNRMVAQRAPSVNRRVIAKERKCGMVREGKPSSPFHT
jgi:hypothetical protein